MGLVVPRKSVHFLTRISELSFLWTEKLSQSIDLFHRQTGVTCLSHICGYVLTN